VTAIISFLPIEVPMMFKSNLIISSFEKPSQVKVFPRFKKVRFLKKHFLSPVQKKIFSYIQNMQTPN